MFKISKNEPDFFRKIKKKVSRPGTSDSWEESTIISLQLKQHILKNEQHSICAYCETKLKENNSHIDHFRTRHQFPEKTWDYNNLLVSCNDESICAKNKDKKIKSKSIYDNIINPTIENPNDFIDYLTSGDIVAIDENKKAKNTIDIFQLCALNKRRERIAKTLYGLDISLKELHDSFENEFKSFIEIVFKKIKQKELISP